MNGNSGANQRTEKNRLGLHISLEAYQLWVDSETEVEHTVQCKNHP